MDIRLIFLNRRSLYTVHGEIFGADSWYVSVQPSRKTKGVKDDLYDRRFWLTRWLEKQMYVWVLPPVPQTNTGTRVEKTQAYERTFAKELGNTATVTSG